VLVNDGEGWLHVFAVSQRNTLPGRYALEVIDDAVEDIKRDNKLREEKATVS
jgi:hypothetical protein